MRTTLGLDTTRPWAEVVDLARRAEAAGWSNARIGDAAPGPECWAVAGALACAVPRLGLQVIVDDGRGRHPAVVAKLASTVDLVSGGRLVLGMAPAGDRDAGDRLAEAFAVVRSLARQPRSTMAGRFYRLQDAPLEPKARHVSFPLMLAGGDGELAARIADHWTIDGRPEPIAAYLAALRTACDRAGRDPGEVTVSAPYPATGGVDEWVVADAELGDGPGERQASLARIVDEAARA